MRRSLFLFTAILLPALGDQLPTRPPVLQLSLRQAVQIALAPEGNTRVQLAQEALKQAETRSAQSRAALLPDFDGYFSGRDETTNLKAFGIQFPNLPLLGGFQFPTIVGPFTVFDARANVSQTVFDFSAIRRFQASKVTVEATKLDREGTDNQVTDQVARAYLAGVRAQASVEVAQADAQLSEALLELARRQKTAGTGTGIEITRAQVQLANDRQKLLVAENDRDVSHLRLLKVIGVRLDSPVELTGKLGYAPMEPPDEAQAIAQAKKARPELKGQRQREDNARLNYSATKWERLPSLAGFADYGTIGTGIADTLPTREYGLTLRVPLWDGGRRDARRAESASEYRQERIQTADLGDQIDLDVRTAIASLRSADAQVKTAEEGRQLAEQELAQARRRYEGGVASSIEVTDAQNRLDRALDNRVAALYNYNLARIDFATATGTIQSIIP